jgi:hypothetical protein
MPPKKELRMHSDRQVNDAARAELADDPRRRDADAIDART